MDFLVFGCGQAGAATSGRNAGRGSDGVRVRHWGMMSGGAKGRMCCRVGGRRTRREQERRRKRAGCAAG